MFILLDGKGLEPALPDVTTGLIASPVLTDMRGQQPVHPAAEIAIVIGPQGQMEMIGHQAISQHAHRRALAGLGQEGDEGLVVTVVMKNRGTGIPTVEDVVADPSN